MKINPKGQVPAMLVGPSNKPISESNNIIQHIDLHFDGKTNLMAEINSDLNLKKRFNELISIHDQINIRTFTLATISHNNIVSKYGMCYGDSIGRIGNVY